MFSKWANEQEEDEDVAVSPPRSSQRATKNKGSLNVDEIQSKHGVDEYKEELRTAGQQPASGLNVGRVLADDPQGGCSSKEGKRKKRESSGGPRKRTKTVHIPDVEELTLHLIETKYNKVLANLDPAGNDYTIKLNNIYLYAQTEKTKAEALNELRLKHAEYEDKNAKFLELQHDTAASVQWDINQLTEKIKELQAKIDKLEEKKAKMEPNKVQALKATIAKKAADSAEKDVEAISKDIKQMEEDLAKIDTVIQRGK